MPQYAVILPAAGKSTRFTQHGRKKPFVELQGRAVWLRAVDLFLNRDDVTQILLVIAPDDLEWFKEKFAANPAFMAIDVVTGGTERFDSVRNAMSRLNPDVDMVAVHDAARPILTREEITAVFRAAETTGAAIPAVAVTSTLKRVGPDKTIRETVSRSELYQAQTPQVFRRDLLEAAFSKLGSTHPTDEAQMVEAIGHPVTVVEGSPLNLKITTMSDLKLAEAALSVLPKPQFRPLHPFADEFDDR